MKTIYIDSDCKCHIADDGTMTAVEVDFFDGKCDAYIEGFRYIPIGRYWIRDDGRKFRGLMIAPWKDIRVLSAYQEQYIEMLASDIAQKAAAYDILTEGVML